MPKIDSILISQPRSGTHFLTSILRNNNFNWAKDEPLYYFLEQNFDYYNKSVKLNEEVAAFFSYYLNKKLPGFKTNTGFSSHIFDLEVINGLEYFLNKNNNLKVIFLTRKNLLKRYVSRKIAKLTQNYVNSQTTHMVSLNTEEVKQDIDYCKKEQELFLCKLKNLNVQFINLTYEELYSNPAITLEKIDLLLGTGLKFLPSTKKQENRHLSDIIVNYNQLKDELNGTDYMQYFDK